jgi:hypothetical protein
MVDKLQQEVESEFKRRSAVLSVLQPLSSRCLTWLEGAPDWWVALLPPAKGPVPLPLTGLAPAQRLSWARTNRRRYGCGWR